MIKNAYSNKNVKISALQPCLFLHFCQNKLVLGIFSCLFYTFYNKTPPPILSLPGEVGEGGGFLHY